MWRHVKWQPVGWLATCRLFLPLKSDIFKSPNVTVKSFTSAWYSEVLRSYLSIETWLSSQAFHSTPQLFLARLPSLFFPIHLLSNYHSTVHSPSRVVRPGSHSGEYEDDNLLGHSAVQSRSKSTFEKCVLPPSSGRVWNLYSPLKCRSTSTILHGTLSQMSAIFCMSYLFFCFSSTNYKALLPSL